MQRKTEEALQRIEERLQAGENGAAEFLPSERELCRQFSIGRGALRAIFDELVRRKQLYHVPGKGMKVLNQAANASVTRKFILVMPESGARTGEIANILCGAASAAADLNAELLLFFSREDGGNQLAARLADGNCDGVIFLERFPAASREAMEQSVQRYVVANFEEPGDIPAVRMDLRGIGRMAGRYLVEHGIRHVGFLGGGDHPYIYKEMLAGLKGALAEEDIVCEQRLCRIFEKNAWNQEREMAAEKLLRTVAATKGHCAIFAGRDRWAHDIWQAAQRLGMAIPDDVSVIGYDNVSWTDGSAVGLTTIQQPAFAIGETAVKLLNDAAEQQRPVESAQLLGKLIERNSVKYVKIPG